LIGVTITCAVILCAWGIGSGRGNPVESSLLFAYVVLCIYQIFTDYLPSPEAMAAAAQTAAHSEAPVFPPLPPIIMASYSTALKLLSSLPAAVSSSFVFLHAAFQTVTASVIISLTYRIFVFYAATRIIPNIRENGAHAFSEDPVLEESEGAGKLLALLSGFSPSILVAVYTSLLMQHSFSPASNAVHQWWTLQGGSTGGDLWRWTNLAATMGLYAIELYLGTEDSNGGLTGHWKTD
jgi:hypothetical protein